MTGHSSKRRDDGERCWLESPVWDHRVHPCPGMADGVGRVSDAD